MIVDDSEVIRKRLVYLLSEIEGVDVVGQANNVKEGLEMHQSLNPDLIILDIRMPGESGFALLQKVKQETPHTAIAILTNYPYAAYRDRSRELGADFFFNKAMEFEKIKQLFNEEERAALRISPPNED